jgi:hypothetical protein
MKPRFGVFKVGSPFLVMAGVFVLVLAAPAAQAWGCKGHQTVALIAEKYLTPQAKQMILALLSGSPIDPAVKRYCGSALTDFLGDASTWADDVRGERKNGPWHYIDIPRGAKRGPLVQFCGNEGCVTQALAEQIAILTDKNADGAKRADAARYVIHFVGDLHQPLHASSNDDEGGNCLPVKYLRRWPREHANGFSPNLHGLWDTAIPERDMEGADPGEYAERLEEEFGADVQAWKKVGIHVEEWAWESHEAAEKVAYGELSPQVAIEPNMPVHSCADDNNIGERLLAEHIIADERYQEQAARVVERRLAQAGVRLAMILNEAAKATP